MYDVIMHSYSARMIILKHQLSVVDAVSADIQKQAHKLFLLTGLGVPCNDTTFRNCISKLIKNSLLDMYRRLDGDTRYNMHTLIKSYFNAKQTNQEYHSSYHQMFSLNTVNTMI